MLPRRYWAFAGVVLLFAVTAGFAAVGRLHWVCAVIPGLFVILGVHDITQTRHSVLRNYPLWGHFRFLFEFIRPEIRQYFVEDDTDERPYSRAQRSIVYQRAKGEVDSRPFGTEVDVKVAGHEWIGHSLAPSRIASSDFRVTVGEGRAQPYSMSVFNISAMSFGALSGNAIRALNRGAKLGNFIHDTGEGSISPYHREEGGDLIWEVASGYFGCRDANGRFDPDKFAEQARNPQVKMIEVKLSQGAKPGHGGVLPAAKVTPEIAATRGIPIGQDCISPAAHSEFNSPLGLLQFVDRLRTLSGGKPTGFKLCIGHPWEFFGIVKAMLESGILPDFIVVDGAEGGTGAAPLGLPTTSARRCRKGCCWCTTRWSVPTCATRSRSVRRARSSRRLTWPARWRWAPTGATPHAASCLRWAASRPRSAIPTAARPAWPRKTRLARRRWWCPTRLSACTSITSTRCMRCWS